MTQEATFATRRDQFERSGTPLRKFTGLFIGSDEESRKIFQSQVENRDGWVVNLCYTDMEVHESVTPYRFPTASLRINYTRSKDPNAAPNERGTWFMFFESAEKLGFEDISELIDKRNTLEAEPDHLYSGPCPDCKAAGRPVQPPPRRQAEEEIRGMVWRVVAVEGAAPSGESQGDDQDRLLDLIHGKTASEFASAALSDPVGRRYQEEILSNDLVAGMISTGLVEERDERYWVVAREEAKAD